MVTQIVWIGTHEENECIVFNPYHIEPNHVNDQQNTANDAIQGYMATHERAIIYVDLSQVTWASIMRLYITTTASQRSRGVKIFAHVPTDTVFIRMGGNAIQWFVEKCILRYTSRKIQARIHLV